MGFELSLPKKTKLTTWFNGCSGCLFCLICVFRMLKVLAAGSVSFVAFDFDFDFDLDFELDFSELCVFCCLRCCQAHIMRPEDFLTSLSNVYNFGFVACACAWGILAYESGYWICFQFQPLLCESFYNNRCFCSELFCSRWFICLVLFLWRVSRPPFVRFLPESLPGQLLAPCSLVLLLFFLYSSCF